MTLNNIATISTSYTIRVPIRLIPKGNLPIVKISDLEANRSLNTKRLDRIIPDQMNLANKGNLEDGDVLISGRGSFKAAYVEKRVDTEILATGNIFIIRPNENIINYKFLCIYLNSPQVQKILLRNQKTTTINHITIKDLQSLDLRIPDLYTQIKIVELEEIKQNLCLLYQEKCDKTESTINQAITNLIK
ncbi:MAG: hypothetical protein HC932_00120 [Thermales bacterium]|nr:hypothetical protein [Thermales bacterium]